MNKGNTFNQNTDSYTKMSKISFGLNPLNLVEGERIVSETFAKGTKRVVKELPFAKKVLLAAFASDKMHFLPDGTATALSDLLGSDATTGTVSAATEGLIEHGTNLLTEHGGTIFETTKEHAAEIFKFYLNGATNQVIDCNKLADEVIDAKKSGRAFSSSRIERVVRECWEVDCLSGEKISEMGLIATIRNLGPDISKENIQRFAKVAKEIV